MHTVEKTGAVKTVDGPARKWLRCIDAWDKSDIDQISDLVSRSFTCGECPVTMQKSIKGKKDVAASLRNGLKDFPALSMEEVSRDAGKETVWSESIMRDTCVHNHLLPAHWQEADGCKSCPCFPAEK